MTEDAKNQGALNKEIKSIQKEAPALLKQPPMSQVPKSDLLTKLQKLAGKTKDKFRLGVLQRTADWINNMRD